jgi:hypothetical protein
MLRSILALTLTVAATSLFAACATSGPENNDFRYELDANGESFVIEGIDLGQPKPDTSVIIDELKFTYVHEGQADTYDFHYADGGEKAFESGWPVFVAKMDPAFRDAVAHDLETRPFPVGPEDNDLGPQLAPLFSQDREYASKIGCAACWIYTGGGGPEWCWATGACC